MARRPAIVVPGQKHAHDDFEEIMVEVMRQEHLAQTIARLDAQIDRDESRARAQAASGQRATSQPPSSPGRTGSRAGHRPSPPRVRSQRARKIAEQDGHARTAQAAGILLLFGLAALLVTLGVIFAGAVKGVRLLT